MNRRGFTLIELLAVIVLIGTIAVLITPSILKSVEQAKQVSYDSLISNIVTASQMYYEECEYGDLSNETKYQEYTCKIKKDVATNYNYVEITLGTLANTGFLKVSDTKEDLGKEIKMIKDPKTDNDISNCKIKIIKVVDSSTYKVTYQIIKDDTNDICPTTYE